MKSAVKGELHESCLLNQAESQPLIKPPQTVLTAAIATQSSYKALPPLHRSIYLFEQAERQRWPRRMNSDSLTSSSSKPRRGRRRLLASMEVLMGVVFLGWMMLWIVMPTKTYSKKWNPKLQSATNSTFLGAQGTRILIFVFPVLFMAVVACIYHHLVQKCSEPQRSSITLRLKAWKRPVIVKGPFGVLSAMELAFCFQFLALIVWAFSMFLSNGLSKISSKSAAKNGEKLWQAKLSEAGLCFGLAGNICCAFLFFPVTRSSSLLPLVGLTSESSIKYHIWLGHLVLTLFSSHGLCFIIGWASSGQISEMLKWDRTDVSNVAGEIALLSGLVMWAATIPRVRRKMFELFFYTHQLYFIFLMFFLFHVGVSFFSYVLPGLYLFLVDRYLRFLQSRRRVRLLSARLLPSEAVELSFAKSPGLSYAPTSVVFINVPSVSWMQWHPFTVTSSSNLEPEVLSVLIKKEGKWTQKLHQILSKSSLDHLPVSVEGPYSPVSLDFLSYDSLVLISGGSGITPFISIIRDLLHRNRASGLNTTVLLLCSFKSSSDLTTLDLLLPPNSPSISDLHLRVEAFVTREQAPSSSHLHNTISSICFKPNSGDTPLSPLLGRNAWLCLAAIISTSFVAFLLLIGLLTRYYIFPIDHNTNRIYSYADKSMLNLLFLCFCVAMVASGGVLWNKWRMAEESKQGRVMNALTPNTSPSPWLSAGVSLSVSDPGAIEGGAGSPESVWRITNVHYGGRPDLKRLLLEKDGKSNGQTMVMASGPTGLRREVAQICSSNSANNLHYQSLSFIW